LNVYMPSSAQDAANMIMCSAHGNDPTLILLPKNLFFKDFPIAPYTNLRHDSAHVLRQGDDVTVVVWGNCVELALQAAASSSDENISVEVIDLKSIVPCDMQTIMHSLEKTGRLVVAHEDNRTCGFGQALIAQITSNKVAWDMLYASPQLVCREDVLVPFNTHLAKKILPSADKILAAIKHTMIV
jgi:2-oxoisovalerate dehydrogenase E1 component